MVEGRIAFQEVVERFETLTVPEGYEVKWRNAPFFRDHEEYELNFTLRKK